MPDHSNAESPDLSLTPFAPTDTLLLPERLSESIPGASFEARVPGYQQRVEVALDYWLPEEEVEPQDLHKAMRYSVLGAGKRMRPLLIYAAGEVLGVAPRFLDSPAAAIELVHAFSLVHDDLPAMDDDELRRGKPTTHRAFGEATAILAGDALQVLAFHILANDPNLAKRASVQVALMNILAHAGGSRGMTGGQAIDLESEGKRLTVSQLEQMFNYKTGYLIRASVLMASACHPGLEAAAVHNLDRFGSSIGLAFQIRDDILDVEGKTEVIGKTQGADAAKGKATYPGLFGLEAAKARADELYADAMESLGGFGRDAEPLRWLSDYIVRRDY